MKWFGESWGAPVCDPAEQVPRPDGSCVCCDLAFEEGDSGVILPSMTADGSASVAGFHRACFLDTLGLRRDPQYSQAELIAIAKEMHAVAGRVYALFFHSGMGAKVHAYIEFCGVLNKYVEICGRAAVRGIDFTVANVHGRTALPVEVHDMVYLGEKLECIFGPMLASNPEAREALRRALFPEGG